jgi:hypothetical protein
MSQGNTSLFKPLRYNLVFRELEVKLKAGAPASSSDRTVCEAPGLELLSI